MAKGEIRLSCPQGRWAGKILWESTPIAEENASSVSAACYVWRTDGGVSFGNNPYCGRLWIGSQQTVITFPRVDGNIQCTGSCWAKILHNSEGLASAEIGASIDGSDNNDLFGTTLSGRQVIHPDPIALAGPSRISLNAEALQMGKRLLISIDRDQPDCLHDLSYSFGSTSGSLGEKIGSSYEWTVPDLAAYCGLQGTCTVFCKTYRKGKYLGKTEASLTLLVPDPTTPRLEAATLGSPSVIRCERNAGNFTLSLSLILKGREYALGEGKLDSLNWTPEYALAGTAPDLVTFSGTLRCVTSNGGVQVGVRESPIRLTVPENEFTRPRITSLVLKPVSEKIPEKFGYLRGKTGLQAEFTADSPVSQIEGCFLTVGRAQAEGNPAVIRMLEDPGLLHVVGRVRDQRGFTASLEREIQVLPYEKPRVIPIAGAKTIVCQRAEKSGALSQQGTCLAIRAGIRYTEIQKEGIQENSCTLRYRWKTGEGAFGPWIPLLSPGQTQVSTLIEGIVTSLQKSYQVELSALDTLGEEDRVLFTVMTQAISFALYDGTDGAAFGKYPELPHTVDLAPQMTLLVRGRLELRGEAWENLGLAPGIRPPVSSFGRAEECACRVSGGNHVFLAFCCGLPGETMAVNREPVPEGLRPVRPVTGLCPTEGGIALVTCGTDGFLRVKALSGGETSGWIDGYLDYFL